MDSAVRLEPRREPWRYAVRAVLTLAVGAGVAVWLLLSWALWAYKCGDNCGVGEVDQWQWAGQFALALPGALLAILALALGFTTQTRAYRISVAVSVWCALLWAGWVLLSGNF